MTITDSKQPQVSSGTTEHQQPHGFDRAKILLDEGAERFAQVVAQEQLTFPAHGSWEAALTLAGKIPPHAADQDFLHLIDRANPEYTGWPVWKVTSRYNNPADRPRAIDKSWEELIVGLGSVHFNNIDFIKLDPQGRFFERRAYQEDVDNSDIRPQSLALITFDMSLPVMRVAEAIAVGCAMANAMGCDPAKTSLIFGFRWNKLLGRELTCRPQYEPQVLPGKKAHQDEVTSFVEVPLSTQISAEALCPYVNRVIKPLHRVFDGFVLDPSHVENLTRYILKDPKRRPAR